MDDKELYRITEDWDENGQCCSEYIYIYKVIKETKCGVWISLNRYADIKRFVNLSSVKKYAYPTLKEAREGYLHRKQAHVRILTSRLEQAEKALEMAKELVKEVE